MKTNQRYYYNHFAKPADVWKHLVLCEAMLDAQPKVYVETNSAYACYHLERTPEQEYGIYNFINKATDYPELFKSKYYELEEAVLKGNQYLGSSGLAISMLRESVEEYYFFDVEQTALDNIASFAKYQNLNNRVELINKDSVIGALALLPKLPASTLIHIDPYNIDKPSSNGIDYLDVFIEASEQGKKCALWYGFNTLNEKRYLNDFLTNKLSQKKISNLTCVELIMDIIQKDSILSNPGILGNGMLTSNFSDKFSSTIQKYSKSLTDLYKNTFYNGFKGDMYREVINLGKTQSIKRKRSRGQRL